MAQKIVLGITGSIAAYKTIELAKALIENCFEVQIVLSKKDQVTPCIGLTKNVDIIQFVKQTYPHIFCVGFAAETNNIKEYGLKKLNEKDLDLIAINDVSGNNVFGGEHNELHIISKDSQFFHLARDTKENIAKLLLEIIGTQLFNLSYHNEIRK